jgi:hypothetical protein
LGRAGEVGAGKSRIGAAQGGDAAAGDGLGRFRLRFSR